MEKIISYRGEKFILSEKTSEVLKDTSNVEEILKIPDSDSYSIMITNGSSVYWGTCKKHSGDKKFIKKYYYTENGTQLEIEKMILDKLSEAYNLFTELEKQHSDENDDFVDGIHRCQYVIGMRYAKKHRPDLFQKNEEDN